MIARLSLGCFLRRPSSRAPVRGIGPLNHHRIGRRTTDSLTLSMDSEEHYILSRVMERYVPAEPTPPDSPDAFRFATSGKLLNILREAGATASSERVLDFRIVAPLLARDFWILRSEMSD